MRTRAEAELARLRHFESAIANLLAVPLPTTEADTDSLIARLRELAAKPLQLERELTTDERMRWGRCHVCKAEHGKRCNPDVGIALGLNARGLPPREGVHLGRLQGAPFSVRLVGVE